MTRLSLMMVLGVATCGLAAAPAAAQQAGTKIAFVNARAILQQTPGYAQAESTWTRELNAYRIEIQRLQATFDSAAQAFEQSSIALSSSARAAKRKELEDQQGRLEQRLSELQEQSVRRERELLDPIQARVNAVIDGVRAAGNYAMIFDVSAQNVGIVSADKALDLTQRVIDQIKAGGN